MSQLTIAGTSWSLRKIIPQAEQVAIGRDIQDGKTYFLVSYQDTQGWRQLAYDSSFGVVQNLTVPALARQLCYSYVYDWKTNEYVGRHWMATVGDITINYAQGCEPLPCQPLDSYCAELECLYWYPDLTNNCDIGIEYEGQTYWFWHWEGLWIDGTLQYLPGIEFGIPHHASQTPYLAYAGDYNSNGLADIAVKGYGSLYIWEDPPANEFDLITWVFGLFAHVFKYEV